MRTAQSTTRLRVYEALSAREASFVSGEALGEGLGLSRTAVWKAITALRATGCIIESAGGRGYRLLAGGCDLTPETVAGCLRQSLPSPPGGACRSVVFFKEIGSTNDEAKNLARKGAGHGSVVVADSQTAGRGRLGRTWFSPPGAGLWVSLILRPSNMPLVDAPKLTGRAAIAVVDAVSEVAGVAVQVKWPNDLYVAGRKLCGIFVR